MAAVLLVSLFLLNYYSKLYHVYITGYGFSLHRWVIIALVYFFIYSTIILVEHKKYARSDLSKGLVKAFFLLVSLSFVTHFKGYIPHFLEGTSGGERYFIYKIVRYGGRLLKGIVVVGLIWYLIDRRKPFFYGLNPFGKKLRPYFIMLGIMAIPIFAVSFLPDFQRSYPMMNVRSAGNYGDLTDLELFVLLQPIYMTTFIIVELTFRGMMIMGLERYFGTRTVLPQAVIYGVFHFGKPFGEALGSIFGGYILAVLSLRTRTIYGGIILHMGVAFLMELAAYFQIWIA